MTLVFLNQNYFLGDSWQDNEHKNQEVWVSLRCWKRRDKSVLYNKGNYKQGKQPSEWEKIIANETTDKQLIWKINKQLMQLNTRKKNNPIKKWVKELNRHSPKKTYRLLINRWKDTKHHSLSEKCKSKPQWVIISHQSEWPSSKSPQTINAG